MANILFVCVHNSGRSQMAEALFNKGAMERGISARAASAGTIGAGTLNPIMLQAMEEIGVPMIGHRPKQLTPEMVAQASTIVSMGCGVDAEACPAKFLVTEDWGLDDPAGQALDSVRRIRDQIEAKVEGLLNRV